jgi:GR25 family glycosyltransferase involved in LPS biosynthesis
MNITFYRLFNPDLKNFSNKFLINHWNNFGKNEDRIYSYESFFAKYPYFDYNIYKTYNEDINLNEKLDLMVHWHLEGIHQNRICFINKDDLKKSGSESNLSEESITEFTEELNKINKSESFSNVNENIIECDNFLKNNNNNINNFLEKFKENEINIINESIKLIINYIYPKENKNIIIKLTNNINDIFFKFFIGMSISIYNKVNIYFIQDSNLFKKISLFKNFHNKVIKKNTLYNFSIYDNIVDDYKLNLNSLFGNNESILLSNFKYSIEIFNDYFIEIKNLLYYEKKIKLLKILKILKYKKNIGLHISTKNINNIDELYYIKCLGLLNYHEMNIIIFTDNKENLKKFEFLKNINFILSSDLIVIKDDFDKAGETFNRSVETDLILLSLCNYIISSGSNFSLWSYYLSNVEVIYIPVSYYFVNTNCNFLKYNKNLNIKYIDNFFNKQYLENKILITNKNKYFYNDNSLYLLKNTDSVNNFINTNLYIGEYIIDKFIGKKIIRDYFNNDNDNNKNDIFINKINIILFFNEKNYNNFENNISILLQENYKNYNIIIFFLNIDDFIINDKKIFMKNFKNNIFVFSNKNNNIINYNIIIALAELSENNSLILIIDNNFILDIQFSLEYINSKFCNSRNEILELNCYQRNIIISTKEYFLSTLLNNNEKNNIFTNFHKSDSNINLIEFNENNILYNYLKSIFLEYNFSSENNFEYNEKYSFNSIVNHYLAEKEYNFSLKKINILYDNQKIYKYFNNIFFHNILLNNCQKIIKKNIIIGEELNNISINNNNSNIINYLNDDFRNILIENYINNILVYPKTIFSNIYNTNALIQIIIFIYEGLDNEKINNKLEYINNLLDENFSKDKCQINIIEFNKFPSYEILKTNSIIEKYKINYFFYDKHNYKNIKYNKAFAYNIILNQFNTFTYNFEYLLFDDFNSNFDYNIDELLLKINNYYIICCKNNNLNNKIFTNLVNLIDTNNSDIKNDKNLLYNNSIIFFHKNILNNVSNFDSELFYYNSFNIDFPSFNETLFFIEKVSKFYSIENIEKKNILYEYESKYNNVIYYNFLKNNENFIDNKLLYKYIESYYYFKNIYELFKNLNNNNFLILLNFMKHRYFLKLDLDIKTFFINLDERTDRLNNCLDEINSIKLCNFERFSGIKPNREELKNFLIDLNNNKENINYNFPKFINPEKVWKKNNIEYLRGIIGCKMSHLEILRKALNYKEQYIMILEDDIVFENNTLIYLELALNNLKKLDWDILYLTTNIINIEDAIRVDTNLLYLKKSLTTTAQIFKKDKIMEIINIIQNSDAEIDNTYNDLLTNKYCVYPMCGYQRESWSDINKQNMNYGQFHKKFTYEN